MNKNVTIILLIAFTFISCKKDHSNLDANQILGKAIESSGKRALYNATLKFNLEDVYYASKRKGHQYEFQMKRAVDDSTEHIAKALNGGFEYKINDEVQDFGSRAIEIEKNLTAFINFMTLPAIFENDNSLLIQRKEDIFIRDQLYFVINILLTARLPTDPTISYNLYVNPNNFDVEFIAYDLEPSRGVIFLKEAINKREVDGVVFNDFITYYAPEDNYTLNDLPNLLDTENLAIQDQDPFDPKNITIEYLSE